MEIDLPAAMSIATTSFLCITAVSPAIGDAVQDPNPASIEETLQRDGGCAVKDKRTGYCLFGERRADEA